MKYTICKFLFSGLIFLSFELASAQNGKRFNTTDTSFLDTSNTIRTNSWLWKQPNRVLFENEIVDTSVLHNGYLAPDFSLLDTAGNRISLSDFRGKVVYLDIWATWCSPCVAELSKAKHLEEEFQGKNVVFIYISIDSNELSWLKMIREKKVGGIHLISKGGFNSALGISYKLKSIPQYFLIDKTGIIVNNDAQRPSQGAHVEIQNLLNEF